jgi:hypothetical protein
LEALPLRIPTRILRVPEYLLQRFAWAVHNRGWDKTEAFTWLYIAVGHKPE